MEQMSYFVLVGAVVGKLIYDWGHRVGLRVGRAVGFQDGYDYRKGQERRVKQ